MMMRLFRLLVVLILLCAAMTSGAQEPITLLPDQAVTVTLAAGQPAQLVFTMADASDLWATVQARSLLPDDALLDPVLWVTDEQFHLLAYDDNGADGDDLNAQIAALPLTVGGVYHLFVHTFSGAGAGDVEITLTLADPFDVEITEREDAVLLRVWLPAGEVFRYPLTVQADEALTITARDLSGTLDPLLRVVTDGGELLAANDDHGTFDPRLNVLDARIADWSARSEQIVLVEVLDFLARAGYFELLIQQNRATNP